MNRTKVPPVSLPTLSVSRNAWLLVGLFLVGLTTRLLLIPFADNYDGDALSRVITAEGLVSHPRLISNGWWPSLHFYLLAASIWITNNATISPVVLTALLGALTAVPLALFVKLEFNSERAGLIAGLLYLFAPLSLRLSLLTLAEIPLVFFLWVCLYLLRKGEQQSGKVAYLLAAAGALSIASGMRQETWLLAPILALLFISGWKHRLLFAMLGSLFPIIWVLSDWWTTGTFLNMLRWLSAYGQSYQETFGGALSKRSRVTWLPAMLLLNPSLLVSGIAMFGIIGFLRTPRLLRTAGVALIVALVEVAGNSLGWHTRYAFVPMCLFIPYAAVGLDRILAAIQHRRERYALIAILVLSAPILPYFLEYSGVFSKDLKPVATIGRESREVANWLRSHTASEEALVLDHMWWREVWLMHILNKDFDTVWIAPVAEMPESPDKLPIDDLRVFLQQRRPRYMVYSEHGDITKTIVNPCPDQEFQPALGVYTAPVLSTGDLVVCELTYNR